MCAKKQKKNKKRNVTLLLRLDLEKILVHCDGWFTKICVYRENVLYEKRFSLVVKVRLGKVHWRVFPGATSWRVLRQSKVGLVNSAATWKPRCYSAGQIPRIYAILRGCPRLLITDLNHEPLTESIELKNLKWPSFSPLYCKKRENHVETWNKKGIHSWFTCDITHMLQRPA